MDLRYTHSSIGDKRRGSLHTSVVFCESWFVYMFFIRIFADINNGLTTETALDLSEKSTTTQ